MTIKQHGGVFGRNPSFNDVSVETLSIAGTALLSTAAELNILDGVTADATELNYLDGASTSAVVASKAVLADASGNIAFPDGKGIDFSATADGSGTASSELFDDYEEGAWTPTLQGGTTDPTVTYTIQSGSYTKIGNLVRVDFSIAVSAISGGSGGLFIGPLPYTPGVGGANNTQRSTGVINYNNLFTETGTDLTLLAIQSSAFLRVNFLASNNLLKTGGLQADDHTGSGTRDIQGSIVYFT